MRKKRLSFENAERQKKEVVYIPAEGEHLVCLITY
jgi:hypothetical protein